MSGHWFVIASQNTVKIFTEISANKKLEQFQEFNNTLGRVRNRVLVRKQAGHGVKSVGRGSVHYSEKKRLDPHEKVAFHFAKEVTGFLAKEYQQKKFRSLTVFAEPHFLGKLKTNLKRNIPTSAIDWIKKDLLKTPKKELRQSLLLAKSPTPSPQAITNKSSRTQRRNRAHIKYNEAQ